MGKLRDGQKSIVARMWDYCYTFCPINDTVVKVDAVVQEYQGQQQMILNHISPAKEDEYAPRNFLPTCPEDIDDLGQKISGYIAEIKDITLSKIITNIFSDYETEFTKAPAAIEHHHAYLGGLIHHTVNVTQKALSLSVDHQEINRDLVIAGALLHDIGKIRTYDWSGITIKMTDEGRFLGHIVLGLSLIGPYFEPLDWLVKNKLFHIIAAHHGKLEWGSPVEPVIPEAYVVFMADLTDARLYKMVNIQSANKNSNWSAYVPGFGKIWTGE